MEVEAQTVLRGGRRGRVVLRPVEPHDHVEGQLGGVDGDGGGGPWASQHAPAEPVVPGGGRGGGQGGAGGLDDDVVRGAGVPHHRRQGGGGAADLEACGGDGGPGYAAVAQLRSDTDGVLLVRELQALVVVE